MAATAFHVFGNIHLASGETLLTARLGYTLHGRLNAQRDNAILFPTWFGATARQNEWIIGPGRALDTNRFFIIVVDNIGNGISSSPSDIKRLRPGHRFPLVSLQDHVTLQRRLLLERFGITHLRLIIGRSMGAQMAFQWGALHPEAVGALIAIAGSARTSAYNKIFLNHLRLAITSAPLQEFTDVQPAASLNERLRTIFDGWGLSAAFYRERRYQTLGFSDLESYLRRPPPDFGEASDLLAQIDTWMTADISANPRFNGDLTAALGAIIAPAVVMPSSTDLYFAQEDAAAEAKLMPNAELRMIHSAWGHRAGAPGTDPADIAFIETTIRDLLLATE